VFDLVFQLSANKKNAGEPLKSAKEVVYKARATMIHGSEVLSISNCKLFQLFLELNYFYV
jgi:hypothetical protein